MVCLNLSVIQLCTGEDIFVTPVFISKVKQTGTVCLNLSVIQLCTSEDIFVTPVFTSKAYRYGMSQPVLYSVVHQ